MNNTPRLKHFLTNIQTNFHNNILQNSLKHILLISTPPQK